METYVFHAAVASVFPFGVGFEQDGPYMPRSATPTWRCERYHGARVPGVSMLADGETNASHALVHQVRDRVDVGHPDTERGERKQHLLELGRVAD